MEHSKHVLTLTIDTEDPIELAHFVGSLTSLADEYKQFARNHADLVADEAKVFVSEVRKGSYVADLIPVAASTIPLLASYASDLKTIEEFVKLWAHRASGVINGVFPDKETKSNAKHWLDTFAAVANSNDGKGRLAVATYENGKTQERYSFSFDAEEAKDAMKTIDGVYERLEAEEHLDHERVLLTFTRTDVGDAKVGKPSGERVKIEEISERPLALTYASELAEEKIKHEIRDVPENIYQKGFVVDVNVQTRNTKPVAYSVVNVHEIVLLPEDGNTED
ncbi:hypothetical protein [uncultured Shimia sp.]|uniref:hypothetical protein n=1 Tax=uncultured Shimia sp. TaxID=573152 RepID=UPI00262892A8|nr:hypothetical protein [uncultured Shimia sp.]